MQKINQDSSGANAATVFTAFVAKQANGPAVQVQVSQSSVLDVLVDGYRLSFSEPSLYTQRFSNVLIATNSRDAAVVTVTFSWFSFWFSAANGAMSIIAAASDDAAGGKYVGLLGNFDGSSINDLRTPDGVVVPANANISVIHYDFGMQWLVSENDSLFAYSSGQSYASYYDPQFQPNFQLPDVSTLSAEVLEVCGGSTACSYDYSVTGSLQFANQTVVSEKSFNETATLLQQQVVMCPPLNHSQNGYMEATNFFDGAKVSFTCDTNYYIVGSSDLRCEKGQWNSGAPVCNGSWKLCVPFFAILVAALLSLALSCLF
jgi:hypothetical protein